MRSAKGTVAAISTDTTAPEISPKTRIVFFIFVSSGAETYLPDVNLSSFFRVIFPAKNKIMLWHEGLSANQPELLAQLHRLGPTLGPEFIENPAGVGFDRVFAHK